MKLWQKEGTAVTAEVDRFTVGRDRDFDLLLAPYDIRCNRAHAAMLAHVGLLTHLEEEALQKALDLLEKEVTSPEFQLPDEAEDIHSFLELRLTEMVGEAGKKIHTGRSRNDQVATDIKLYLKDAVAKIQEGVQQLFHVLLQQADTYKAHLMPGYTHMQMAMPSSGALWLGAYAESLIDDLEGLSAAARVVNKNPLGSGAGFGSSFPLDRQHTTNGLGFAALNVGSVYAQMTRGKSERVVAQAMAGIASTLSRLSFDCCLYLNQHFALIQFPDSLTTGSSIMPHKKNPDVFELIRAKCNLIQAIPQQLTLLTNNLPSGYQRDYQLTKEVLFPAVVQLLDCLEMMALMMQHLTIRDGLLEGEMFTYLFTVEAMNGLVNNGISYREAYQQIGAQVQQGKFTYPNRSQLNHTHIGSIGNPGLQLIAAQMQAASQRFAEAIASPTT